MATEHRKLFIVENEIATNRLAVRILWVAVAFMYLAYVFALLKIFPREQTNYLYSALLWTLIVAGITGLSRHKPVIHLTKYFVIFGFYIMYIVYCVTNQNDLSFQPGWLLGVGLASLYLDPKLTMVAGASAFLFGFITHSIYPVNLDPNVFIAAVIGIVMIVFFLIMVQCFLSQKTHRIFAELMDKEEREKLLDQIQRAVNQLGDAFTVLNNSAQQFTASTEEVSQAAAKIASNSNDVFEQLKGTKDKNDQILIITSDLAAFAEEVAASTEHSDDFMRQTMEIAAEEERAVSSFVSKINTINQKIVDTLKTIGHMQESSKKIRMVNEVIQSIARQTRLLSLNASIEAARAGEMGRGFAVVAKEIQKLAQMSAESSEKIDTTIYEITGVFNMVITEIQESASFLQEGVSIISKTNNSLRRITESCQSSSAIINEIAEGTQRQAESMNKITSYLHEMNQNSQAISTATEEIAAGSAETSAAAEEIAAQAQQLAWTAHEIENMLKEIQGK